MLALCVRRSSSQNSIEIPILTDIMVSSGIHVALAAKLIIQSMIVITISLKYIIKLLHVKTLQMEIRTLPVILQLIEYR